MSLLSRLNNAIPNLSPAVIQTLPDRTTFAPLNGAEFRMIGNELTIYPEDGGERYIDKGYKRNDAVYSIVSRNAEKCSQIRLYHLAVKRAEQKTAAEYVALTKGAWNEKVVKEFGKMRKAMTEDLLTDSPLQKLLNKPNRNQTQSEWIEDIVGLREMQGEGNIWLIPAKDPNDKRPKEMFNVPKPQLLLIGDGSNPWNIIRFEILFSGNTYPVDAKQVLMWKYPNKTAVDALTMEHLRGMAPLQAGMLLVQAMNEGDLRIATSNKNGGAMGLAYRTDVANLPTDVGQKAEMRQQFNNIVNSNEMANKVAMMGGNWGYLNFSSTVKDQQLLEQYGIGFKRLCRIFKTPAQIFDEGNTTWDNQRASEKRWIYSKISPIMASLRDKLHDALLSRFGLDPERHIIDFDIASLPELSEDVKDLVAAYKDADWISDNEKRAATGFDMKDNPVMDLTQREYEQYGIAGSLDEEMRQLNG